ncbi:hypothetical protein ACIQBJ_03170 [Kitasatospora sp. NPDC088391]|uniref:hypothetical protein n=1 Tax=Kitasatospora sp. NPDC088391 TaxID=3364074 RepID=UPI0038219503
MMPVDSDAVRTRVSRPWIARRVLAELEYAPVVVLTGEIGVGKSSLLTHEVTAELTARRLWPHHWAPEPGRDPRQQLEEFTETVLPGLPRPTVLLPTVELAQDDLPRVLDDRGVRVVTSSRRSDQWLPPAQTVEVGRFTPAESIYYLTRSTRSLPPRGAARMAERAGHLPLALGHVAVWLSQAQARSIGGDRLATEFLEMIGDHAVGIYGEPGPDGYPSTLVGETRSLLRSLHSRDPRATRDALDALALMCGGPFPIPVPSKHVHASHWRPASGGLPAMLPQRFRKSLQPAEAIGLVRQDADRIVMGPLEVDLVRGLIAPAERRRVAELALSMLLSRVPANEGRAEWSDWPCWAEVSEVLMAIDPADAVGPEAQFTLLGAVHFTGAQGHYQEAYARLVRLRKAWRPATSTISPPVTVEVRLRALDLLSETAARLDNGKASRFSGAAYRYRRTRQGANHADTLASGLNLARSTGDLALLVDLRERAGKGGHRRLVLRIDSALAEFQLTSHHKAVPVAELTRIHEAQSELLGAGHPETLSALLLLARAHAKNGHAQRALKTYESLVAGRIESLGESHPDTGSGIAALETQQSELAP